MRPLKPESHGASGDLQMHRIGDHVMLVRSCSSAFARPPPGCNVAWSRPAASAVQFDTSRLPGCHAKLLAQQLWRDNWRRSWRERFHPDPPGHMSRRVGFGRRINLRPVDAGVAESECRLSEKLPRMFCSSSTPIAMRITSYRHGSPTGGSENHGIHSPNNGEHPRHDPEKRRRRAAASLVPLISGTGATFVILARRRLGAKLVIKNAPANSTPTANRTEHAARNLPESNTGPELALAASKPAQC
jgi:hypothetical protein